VLGELALTALFKGSRWRISDDSSGKIGCNRNQRERTVSISFCKSLELVPGIKASGLSKLLITLKAHEQWLRFRVPIIKKERLCNTQHNCASGIDLCLDSAVPFACTL